jgi:hypothetical protein
MNKLIDIIVEETDIEKRQILGEALKSILAVPVFYPNTHIPQIYNGRGIFNDTYNSLYVDPYAERESPCSESTMGVLPDSMDVPSGKAYV